jgi:hypothetical protein
MSDQEIMREKCKSILKQLEGLSLESISTLLANVESQIRQSSVVTIADIESIQYQSDLKQSR